jgi:hypothetical protein
MIRFGFVALTLLTSCCSLPKGGPRYCPTIAEEEDLLSVGAFTYWEGWEESVRAAFDRAGVRPKMLGGFSGAGLFVARKDYPRACAVWARLRDARPDYVSELDPTP